MKPWRGGTAKPKLPFWKVHDLNVAVNFAGNKLQVFFQVVGQRSHQDVFVGLTHAAGINPFHVVMVDEGSQHRLYARTPPLGKETCVIGIAPQFFVHFIVQGFVDAVFYLLEFRDLAATLRSQRAVTTGALAAAVTLLSVTLAVGQDSFEGQNGMVSAFLGAAVIIFFFTFSFYKFKPFPLGLMSLKTYFN